MNRQDLDNLFNEVNHSLRYLKTLGIDGADCAATRLQVLDKWEQPFVRKTEAPGEETLQRLRKPTVSTDEDLHSIRRDLGDCNLCQLCKSRNNIVFGQGNPSARLVFVGEGPGADEDRKGLPFVGAAGALLTKIIQAMKLTREDVYICNIVKCRPPANRNPEPNEIESCLPFLERQLKAIRPEVICALGAVAARALLLTDQPVSQLRGRFHDYNGMNVMPTYHPAYLLRNPEKKRAVWEDVQKVMKNLGIVGA